jgi:hypothetical protein
MSKLAALIFFLYTYYIANCLISANGQPYTWDNNGLGDQPHFQSLPLSNNLG